MFVDRALFLIGSTNFLENAARHCEKQIYLGGTFHIDGGRPTPDLMPQTLESLRDVRPNWYFNVPFGFEIELSCEGGVSVLPPVVQ